MSLPVRRSAVINLAVGVFVGALAAAGGVAAILGLISVILLSVDPDPSIDSLMVTFFVSVVFILLAGIPGAAAGLLIAIVDHLIGGRMRDGRMPFWAWLPIGGVTGTVGSILTWVIPYSDNVSTSTIAFYAIIGAFCGLVAGPLFGWFFRERRQREPTQLGVE